MICGIESNHLGNGREDVLDGADAEKMGGVVERSEIAADLDLGNDVLIHQGTA